MALPFWYEEYLGTLKKTGATVTNWYIDVTAELSAVTADLATIEATTEGALQLTAAAEQQYLNAVQSAEKEIRRGVDKIIKTNVTDSLDLSKNAQDAGWINTMKTYLDQKVLNDLSLQTTKYVNDIQFKKVYKYADGKIRKYSDRVWKTGSEYRQSMNSILKNGLNQGRDAVTIAGDLDAYVKGGKKSLAKRYAAIGNDPFEFRDRIPENVDYRSLRLARTTIQGAVQDGAVASNEINPGAIGFDWVLSALHRRYSVCEDIVASNPHTYDNFQWSLAPHPNCLSHSQDRLRSKSSFTKDLKRWVDNPTEPGVGYLNDWKGQYYDVVDSGGKVELNKLLQRNVQEALR